MLTLTVNYPQSPSLAQLMARLADTETLHEAMAMAVDERVRDHLLTRRQSPNTGWWAAASRSVTHTAHADHATVAVRQRGAALHYYGGTVHQRPGGPLLALPTDDVPIVQGVRVGPRHSALGPLMFLPARRPARKGVVGVLVEAELTGKSIQRGKNKGKPAKRRKKDGKLLYVLMSETSHPDDPSVLPTQAELQAAAKRAASDYLDLLSDPA